LYGRLPGWYGCFMMTITAGILFLQECDGTDIMGGGATTCASM
jgi:hypothetical protein